MDPEDYQRQAVQAVKEAAQLTDFSYRGDKDLGRTWAMTFSKSRDSSILEQANYDAVKGDLEKRFPRDVSDERFSHFAVGWLDQLLVRMLDKSGKVTKAGIAALEWKDKLESYPVADDEDYSRREFEATLENIKYEGGLDEDAAQKVYDWLWKNDQMALENVDDKGGYPSKEKIDKALKALGLMELEEGEEKPSTVYVDPPEQQRLWPDP
jgi:hypothetical protein